MTPFGAIAARVVNDAEQAKKTTSHRCATHLDASPRHASQRKLSRKERV